MKAVRHFGIVVSDLQQSLCFYRDLLGLKEVRTMEESGKFIDTLLSLQNVQVTTIKMSADGGPTLVELLEFKSHPRQPRSHEVCSIGPSHIAFTVEHLDAIYHRLSDSGVPFNAPPKVSPDGYAKVAFCRDPDGTPIELVELLNTSASSTIMTSGRV